MRSNYGNHSFILTVCTIIIISSLALNASEYLVSYKYTVKNAVLFNESLDISKSMQKCKGLPAQTLILPSNEKNNFIKLIKYHHEEFIDYLNHLKLEIRSRDTSINSQINSTIIITLKTTCFKVDFNDTFVKITHLRQP